MANLISSKTFMEFLEIWWQDLWFVVEKFLNVDIERVVAVGERWVLFEIEPRFNGKMPINWLDRKSVV